MPCIPQRIPHLIPSGIPPGIPPGILPCSHPPRPAGLQRVTATALWPVLWRALLLLLLLLAVAPAQARQTALEATRIGQLAASLEAGRFVPLEAGLPEGFERYYDFLRATTFDPDTWNDSAHWDEKRQIGLLYGDRKKSVFMAYSAQDHRWRHLPLDNGPAPFAHVYGKVALDPEQGHYYKMSAFRAPRILHRYIIDEERWEVASQDFPGKSSGWEHTDPIEWHDALGRLIYIRENHLYGWRDGQWAEYGKVAVHGYHSAAQYNPVRREMLFIGGNNSRNKVSVLDAGGQVRDLGEAPFNFGIHFSSLTYDPQTGHYLVLQASNMRILWELDAERGEWRKARAWTAGNWPFSDQGGIVPMPIQPLGVILWLHQDGPKLYRHPSAFAPGYEATAFDSPPSTTPPVSQRTNGHAAMQSAPKPESKPDGQYSLKPANRAMIGPVRPGPPPAPPSRLFEIAATLKSGEFRRVDTRLPPGVDSISQLNSTNWHAPGENGTFGVGWSDRMVFDPGTGRLFNILMRDTSIRSVIWLEPDLSWNGVVSPPGLDYEGAERRPYNRLMDGGDGYLYFSPSEPEKTSVGRLVRARYDRPEHWEEFGIGANHARAHDVGDHSTAWHPDIGKFVLYTLGPSSQQDPDLGEGIDGHLMGRVFVWGPGDPAWVPPDNHPDYAGPPGRTQSSGYSGTTLYNPVRREVLIYGGMTQYGNNHPKGSQATATLDAEGRFRRHGASGQAYVAGNTRLTYHPVTGDYLLLKHNATVMYVGDPPRGKPWKVLYDWRNTPERQRPFDRYENWHRVTPLPGTDVLIWSDLRRGIILQRLPADY